MDSYLYMRDYLKLKAEWHTSELECADAQEALNESGEILERKMSNSNEKWAINIKKRSEMDALVDFTRYRLSALRRCSVNISPNPEGGFSAAFLRQMAYGAGIHCTMLDITKRSHNRFKQHVRKFTAYNSAKSSSAGALLSLTAFEQQMKNVPVVVETLDNIISLGSLREKFNNNSVSVIIPSSASREVSLGLVKIARTTGFTYLRILFGAPDALPL